MNCPKCESTDIEKTPLKALLFLALISASGFFTILGIFVLPFLFLSPVLFIASLLVFALPLPNYKCNQCNKAYKKKALTA